MIDKETAHLGTHTSFLSGLLPGHKKVGARDIGRVLKHKLPGGNWVMIRVTSAMVGRTAEEVIARVGRKRTPRFNPRLDFGMTARSRDERPSIGLVMRIIMGASPRELDTMLSNLISTPIGQIAVARAAASIDQGIDAPDGHRAVNPAVVLAAGEMLTSQQVADRMKKTRQGVNEMLKRGAILGIRYGMHWRFPSTQFDRTSPVAGLNLLLSTLAHLDPWDALSVILAPEADHMQRPLDLLKRGDRAAAIAVASRKAADLGSLSSVNRVMAALSADMAAEEEADRAASSLAGRSVF